MAEVRCPMCGKSNPDDFEICQYCQARLIPLGALGAEEQDSSPAAGSEAEEPEPSPAIETPDWLQDIRQDEGAPDWNLEESSEEPSEEPDASEVEPESDFAGLPGDSADWITEEEPVAGQNVDESKPAYQPEEEATSPSGEPGLEPASVPDWLESMRPILQGDASPGSSQPPEPVESTGPLAGLRGVLAADALLSRSHSPATRPTKLRISANQLVHVDLLKELVESEGKAQPLPQKRAISSEHILRWVIALVLCLAVLWSILYPGQPADLPVYQEETAELNRLIEQLPVGGRVLLAFDYQPGLYAEMDAAAYEVIHHLVERNAYLTLVSSSTMGPVLAERFIGGIQSDYPYGIQYVNLGYIPGGTAGLVSLIESMPGTLPYTIEGAIAWGSTVQPRLAPLEDIQSISDYALILVLVDDPDVARSWVEQLTPVMSDSSSQGSLGMVTSAQLEPVVRPYFDTNPRQIHGFVAGLRGGASYTRLNGGSGTANSYWDSFGMGLFMGVVLMLIGGLIFSIYPRLRRTAGPESEAEG